MLNMPKGETALLTVKRLARPPILQPVSFELGAGECVAVRGASGSGKTAMLRALADLDPTDGTVGLDGVDRMAMPAPDWRRRVTYVAAESAWWADVVRQHFADWAGACETAAVLGLAAECGDWPVARLSTGEKQRLGFLRAFMQKPAVLLLDEPTSGLDADATAAVETLVRRHLADSGAALWVTHDRAQARRLAHRVLEVDDGLVTEVRP